ncbi:hypothetical protein CIHG_08929 [Coccidioides immitis H538.4]|uniref:Uncharacterized protein n=1 Tax=Coccidioides immitis H538.4 TaxID=396776 RepID=A0A0J8S4A6_COCIT|nr:hypothetical protein CIHG_08929 [Coccidioides immitis H538.4]
MAIVGSTRHQWAVSDEIIEGAQPSIANLGRGAGLMDWSRPRLYFANCEWNGELGVDSLKNLSNQVVLQGVSWRSKLVVRVDGGEDVTGSIDANILPSPIVSVMGTPLLYDTALS